MPGTKDIYYWDACIFLALLKNEKRPAGEMDGVREYANRFQKNQIIIVTSVLSLTEVLPSKIPTGVDNIFDDLMKRRNMKLIAIDRRIAMLARNIRDYYIQRKSQYNGKVLSTPDALHLSSAILYQVKEYHTFDEINSYKSLGLIPLSGNVAGHSLLIKKPQAQQVGLDL